MDDEIVTQLRGECQCSDDCRAVGDPCISMRAADEIERLRLVNKKIVNAGYVLADFVQHNMACSCTDNDLCKKCSTLNTWEITVHTWQ